MMGQRPLGVDKVIFLPGFRQSIDQTGCQCSVPPHSDHCRHIADLADAQHALRSANGIQIAHPVPHDDHMIRLFDQRNQLIGHQAAAHLAAFFHAVADAAIEGKAIRGHLRRLVTAAALGHIQSLHRHILGFPQGLGPAAYANGHGEVDAGVQRTDLVQHIIAFLGVLLQIALLHHSNIPPGADAAQEAGAAASYPPGCG